MIPMTLKLLGVILGGAVFLLFFMPSQYLIYYDLVLVRFPGHASLGIVRVDIMDMLIGCLGVSVVFRGLPGSLRIPYFKSWLIVVAFMAVSYAVAPQNIVNMTDPVRIVYQLYRYAVRPLLYYPICVLWLRDPKHQDMAIKATIVGACWCGLIAIQQGYSGFAIPGGPYGPGNGNQLGSALIIPTILAFYGTLFPPSRRQWIFFCGAFAILARALLFSGSRGAMVGVAGGVGYILGFMFLTGPGRRRILAVIPVILFGSIALLVARPDLLERPTVQHAMSSVDGTKAGTMQWRIQNRWPHFFQRALDHPILGLGDAVDEEAFGDAGNTPHNGFLALANRHGFIVPIYYIIFFILLIRNTLKYFFRIDDVPERALIVTLPGAAMGLMLHNIVDTTMTQPLIVKFFWMMCALGIVRSRLLISESQTSEDNAEELGASVRTDQSSFVTRPSFR